MAAPCLLTVESQPSCYKSDLLAYTIAGTYGVKCCCVGKPGRSCPSTFPVLDVYDCSLPYLQVKDGFAAQPDHNLATATTNASFVIKYATHALPSIHPPSHAHWSEGIPDMNINPTIQRSRKLAFGRYIVSVSLIGDREGRVTSCFVACVAKRRTWK